MRTEDCCTARPVIAGREVVCGGRGLIRVRGACVHEHVREGLLCLEHWLATLAWPGEQWCAACRDIDGHRCLLVIEPAPEPGESPG